MPALPLTDSRWSGLPLLSCHMDPGRYRIDVHTPMLVIRDEPGTRVEVLGPGGHHAVFRQAPLRFDLFASGLQMDAVSDRPATRSSVIALPPEWMGAEHAAEEPAGLRSRYQFADLQLRRLVGRLGTHHRSGEPLGPGYTRAVSRNIVDRIVALQLALDARHADGAGLHPEARRTVEAFVDAGLQEPLTVAAMAAALGMGIVRFVRDFKLTFQTTPHQYLQRRRLLRARELLLSTDASLTAIALETGFASHSHFSTVFRAATGVTPSSYRRTGPRAGAVD